MEIFIGTYTAGNSQGIYRALWRDETLQIIGCTEMVNPSYLAVYANRLYAIRETDAGVIASYKVESDALTQTGEQSVFGDAPCHLYVLDNRLYISNYGSGTLTIYDLDRDGALVPPPRLIAHEGCSIHARQRAPHVHQAQPTPDGAFLAVCDLGSDAVLFYPLDTNGIHMPAQRVLMPEGAGPRHAAFGTNKMWYVLCELSCDLLVYQGYGSDARLLRKFTLLRDGDPESAGAALRFSPDGTLLLASIRGANALVIWHMSPDGMLSGARWFNAHGNWPRDAAFTPDGRYVLCACERDNRITVFAVSGGQLVFMHATAVPSPTFICFMPAEPLFT